MQLGCKVEKVNPCWHEWAITYCVTGTGIEESECALCGVRRITGPPDYVEAMAQLAINEASVKGKISETAYDDESERRN